MFFRMFSIDFFRGLIRLSSLFPEYIDRTHSILTAIVIRVLFIVYNLYYCNRLIRFSDLCETRFYCRKV